MCISAYSAETMTQPSYRDIAQILIALTQLPHATVAKRAEVQRSNLVNWLKGKEQVLSLDKQLKVCSVLGWHYGGLRRDVVHRFVVENDMSQLRQVLACFDQNTSFPRLYVFPTEGRMATHGAVILAWKSEDTLPLVMLVSRPLTSTPWCQLSAAQIDGASPGILHAVTDLEWLRWWRLDTTLVEAQDYLREYGDPLLENVDMIEGRNIELANTEFIADGRFDALNEPELSQQQRQWLALLAQAKNDGLAFDEILERGRKALSIATS